MSRPPPQSELRQVDPTVWNACAGSSVQIPAVHSRVYYFPQGHLEQSSPSLINHLSSLVLSRPLIPCRVLAVQFLANSVTDEVFTRVHLQPLNNAPDASRNDGDIEDGGGEEEKVVVSFAKILTPSDANNGGGFSVPRFCADSIFPPLDFQADPPVQTLSITDIHGSVWNFRHIYRGTPRRHLLTTGWSKFVNKKKLVAGDSVVFMKNDRNGRLFVGIRRAARPSGDGVGRWSCQVGQSGGDDSNGVKVKVEEEGGVGSGVKDAFWRTGTGRVSAESVMEGVELAVHGLPFEIVYYPRLGLPDFVVKAEKVEAALNVFWTPGMRVKIAMETEDSSRMTWFQGTVSSAAPSDNGPWGCSPWRTLQVIWDEPEVLHHVKRVSPWQVEFGVPTPPPETDFPPMKKFRVTQNPGFLTDGGGQLLPMTGLTDSMTVQFRPSFLSVNTSPAGMQGARHNPFHISSLSDFTSEDTHGMFSDNSDGNKVVPLFNTMTTGLNIGSSQSDYSSPESQSTVHSSGTELVNNQGSNLSSKVGTSSSFQLFGEIIYFKKPAESSLNEVGGGADDVNKAYKDTKGVNLDLSMTYPYMNLLDKLDVECQRSSSVEARPFYAGS